MTNITLTEIIMIIGVATIIGSAIASALVYLAGYLSMSLSTRSISRVYLRRGSGGTDDLDSAANTCNLLNQAYPNDEATFNAEKAKSGSCYVQNCCKWKVGLVVDGDCLDKCG